MPAYVPQGRILTKRREFAEVATDLRYAVCSVVRHRPLNDGTNSVAAIPLGSGFFVAPTVVLTCWHVMAEQAHQPGDFYHFVITLPTGQIIHQLGANDAVPRIQLFPADDLALIQIPGIAAQPFLSVSYADILIGSAIGVAGYPLGAAMGTPDGRLSYDGMIYRVGNGIVTSTYRTNVNTLAGQQI